MSRLNDLEIAALNAGLRIEYNFGRIQIWNKDEHIYSTTIVNEAVGFVAGFKAGKE